MKQVLEFSEEATRKLDTLATRVKITPAEVVRRALGTYTVLTDPNIVSEKDCVAVLGPRGKVKKIILLPGR